MSKGINKCRRLVIKRKINHRKDPVANFLQIVAISSIIIGLIILLVFFVLLNKNFSLLSGDLDLEATGQVGDYVGGLIGAIWALTGVLLFYVTLRLQKNELQLQRKELRLQRGEMKESRIEFQVNRLTNVIYKQVELSETAISSCIILALYKSGDISTSKQLSGQDALQYLVSILKETENVTKKEYTSEDERKKAVLENFHLHIKFFEKNKKELNDLFNRIKNYTTVVNNTLQQMNVPIEKLIELKMIYFTNISSEFFLLIGIFAKYVEDSIDYLEKNGEIEDFSPLSNLLTSLKMIDKYKNETITKESIEKFKKNASLYNETSLI